MAIYKYDWTDKIYFHVFVKFNGDVDFTEITNLIKANTFYVRNSLCKDFKFEQDSISAETIYDKTINRKFFEATEKLEAYVSVDRINESNLYGYVGKNNYGFSNDVLDGFGFYDEFNARIFTGWIAPITKEKLTNPASTGVSFEIVDNNEMLNVDCPKLLYPKKFDETWYVFNPNDPSKSVLHDLLSQTDFFTKGYIVNGLTPILKEVEVISIDEKDQKISEIINDLLYYYHYTYYFDEDGNMMLYDWGQKTVNVDGTITYDDMQNNEAIQRSRKFIEEDGYNVEYSPIARKENARVYREDLPLPSDEDPDGGKTIAGGAYLPADPIHEPTENDSSIYPVECWQSFDSDLLSKDAKIVATYDHVLNLTKDDDIKLVDPTDITAGKLQTPITEDQVIYEADRARVVFRNFSNDFRKIYQFDIRANVIYENGEGSYVLPKDAKNTKKLSVKYITKKADIETFAQLYYNYTIKNGQYAYELSSLNKYGLGKVYELQTELYTAKALLINREFDEYTKKYKYQFVGVDNVAEIPSSGSENTPSGGDDTIPIPKPQSFEVFASRKTFPTSSRYVTQVETGITLEAKKEGITGEVTWVSSDADIVIPSTGDSITFNVPVGYKKANFSIMATCGILSYTTVIEAVAEGAIEPQYILPPKGEYWDVPTKVPTSTNKNEGLISGDYITNKDGVAYRFDSTKPVGQQWIKITGVNDAIDPKNYMDATLASANAILNKETQVEVTDTTASTYGWFKQLVALEAVIHNLFVRNLQVGDGNGVNGFRFRASDYDSQGNKLAEPLFDVMYNDKVIFKIFPASGNIFFGEPNTDGTEPLSGFMYSASTQELISKDRKLVIASNGEITTEGLNANQAKIIDGNFSGEFSCSSIYTDFSNIVETPYNVTDKSVTMAETFFNIYVGSTSDGKPLLYDKFYRASVPTGNQDIFYIKFLYYYVGGFGSTYKYTIAFYDRNLRLVNHNLPVQSTSGYDPTEFGATIYNVIESTIYNQPFGGQDKKGCWSTSDFTINVLSGGNILRLNIPINPTQQDINAMPSGQMYALTDGTLKMKV